MYKSAISSADEYPGLGYCALLPPMENRLVFPVTEILFSCPDIGFCYGCRDAWVPVISLPAVPIGVRLLLGDRLDCRGERLLFALGERPAGEWAIGDCLAVP